MNRTHAMPRPPNINEATVTKVCEAVMVAVVRLLGPDQIGDARRACDIIKAEIKMFFWDQRYASHRDCLLRGSLHQNVVLADVVLACVEKIREPEEVVR